MDVLSWLGTLSWPHTERSAWVSLSSSNLTRSTSAKRRRCLNTPAAPGATTASRSSARR